MRTATASAAIPSEASNIPLAKKEVYNKARGSDMERRAGYNARLQGASERTGDDFDFTCRGDLLFHAIFYPENARRFDDCLDMWREVNRAETHCKAQFAFELVLPLSPDLPLHHNIAMLREFATRYRVRHGVPVQCDIHSGLRDADAEEVPGLRGNPHAHLLIPTRSLGPNGFGDKTRHLNPPFFRGVLLEEEKLRHAWADSQLRYCERHGIALRIEPTGFVPQPRLGPPAGWKGRPDVLDTLELVRQANAEAACDPGQVLDKLTQNNASFTDRELERLLRRHLGKEADAEERIAIAIKDVFAHPDLLRLNDKASGDWSGRYSTRAVREQEEAGLRNLAALADPDGEAARGLPVGDLFNNRPDGGAASAEAIHAALARHPLIVNARDQRAAFNYAVAPGLVKVIEGRAGTGKSLTLAAIREAFEQPDPQGRPTARVIGLSHLNMVKEDMKADGFRETYTVEHMLHQLAKWEGEPWRGVAMVAVDEAAMLSTEQLAGTPANGEKPARVGLLEWARRTGTKLVLVGDDRQLPSIERGGLFTEIAAHLDRLDEERGSDELRARELTTVRRQRDPYDRAIAEHLAQYRFYKAVALLDTPHVTDSGVVKPKQIEWCDDQDAAMDALVEAWTADLAPEQDDAPDPAARRFAFAYTHDEVNKLNERLREAHLACRRERAERTGEEVREALLDVCYKQPAWGKEPRIEPGIPFAKGDRIQFTGTDKLARIFNGNLATISRMDPVVGKDGRPAWAMSAAVDAGGGREVHWRSDEFPYIRHGYAGTGWKGQGKTIDQTYQLFSRHWDAALSYMLLTRFRDKNQLFVASPDGRPDPDWLIHRMGWRRITAASTAWDDEQADAETRIPPREKREPPPRPAAAGGAAPPPPVAATLIIERDRFLQRVRRYHERHAPAGSAAPGNLLKRWDQRLAACRQAMLDGADENAFRRRRDELLAAARAVVAQNAGLAAGGSGNRNDVDLTDRAELRSLVEAADIGAAVDQLLARHRERLRFGIAADPRDPLSRARDPRRRPRGG